VTNLLVTIATAFVGGSFVTKIKDYLVNAVRAEKKAHILRSLTASPAAAAAAIVNNDGGGGGGALSLAGVTGAVTGAVSAAAAEAVASFMHDSAAAEEAGEEDEFESVLADNLEAARTGDVMCCV
jgi:hypothetical protein